MLEHLEIIDHSGHCSARRDADSFYINSGASLRNRLTTADIVTVDLARHTDRGQRAAAARVSPACGDLSRAAGCAGGDAHASALVDAADDGRRGVRAGLRARRAAGRGSGNGLAAVDQHESHGRAAGVGARRRPRRPAQIARRGRRRRATSSNASPSRPISRKTHAVNTWRCRSGSPYVFSAEEQEACRANLWSPALFAKSWEYLRSKVLR